jgi:hypothetical protein
MEAKLFQNFLGGLVQENTPVRILVEQVEEDSGITVNNVAFDIKRIDIVDDVAYLTVDHNRVHIVPEPGVMKD